MVFVAVQGYGMLFTLLVEMSLFLLLDSSPRAAHRFLVLIAGPQSARQSALKKQVSHLANCPATEETGVFRMGKIKDSS